MNACYVCLICGLTYNDCGLTYNDEGDLSVPNILSTEQRIVRLEYRARTFIDAHSHAHSHVPSQPPPTRSTPDDPQEDPIAKPISQRINQVFYGATENADAIFYDKDGFLLGARWEGDPGLAVQNLLNNRNLDEGDEPPDYKRGIWNYRRPQT